MLTPKHYINLPSALLAGIIAVAGPTTAATVDLNGTDVQTLSEAVSLAYADATPAVINITTNDLTGTPDDGQIFLGAPITINGDADGDDIPADILVDLSGIEAAANAGYPDDNTKGYIEIQAAGLVEINNLKIHPNADGSFIGTQRDIVSTIRTFDPVNTGEVGTYNLTNVCISGSDSNNGNAYVRLDTDADLYSQPGIYRWPGYDGSNKDKRVKNHATIQLQGGPGLGTCDITLDHCKAGLGQSSALNIRVNNGQVQVLGGVYGHCARDGIHISGDGVILQGTHEDRLRVIRSTNIPGGNSHCIEVSRGGLVDLIEYVDMAGETTANMFSLRNGDVTTIQYCRGMGKLEIDAPDSRNHTVFISSANITIGTIADCTFVANTDPWQPLAITGSVTDDITIENTIFTSNDQSGFVSVESAAAHIFDHCALPTDGVTSESLASDPIKGAGTPSILAPMNESPEYRLRLVDYDWSDNQGAGEPGNAVGNANVYRPGNPNYFTAATGGTALNGGAGAPAAGIDASEWMLMQ